MLNNFGVDDFKAFFMRSVHEQCVDCDDGRPARADVGGILTKLYLSHAGEGEAFDGFVKMNVHTCSKKTHRCSGIAMKFTLFLTNVKSICAIFFIAIAFLIGYGYCTIA